MSPTTAMKTGKGDAVATNFITEAAVEYSGAHLLAAVVWQSMQAEAPADSKSAVKTNQPARGTTERKLID